MFDPNSLEAMERLLPFYVNGTLPLADRMRIDVALTDSVQLRQSLAEEMAFGRMVKQGGAVMVSEEPNTETRLAAVMDGLEDPASPREASTCDSAPLDKPKPTRSMLSLLNPANWHPAVSLALALALIGQTVWTATRQEEKSYQTASGEDGLAGTKNARLIVRLKGDARWADVEALLYRENLTVISGPNEGLLILLLDVSKSDIKVAREHLREAPQVEFAEFSI